VDEEKARAWLEGLLDGARQTLASCALKVRRRGFTPLGPRFDRAWIQRSYHMMKLC